MAHTTHLFLCDLSVATLHTLTPCPCCSGPTLRICTCHTRTQHTMHSTPTCVNALPPPRPPFRPKTQESAAKPRKARSSSSAHCTACWLRPTATQERFHRQRQRSNLHDRLLAAAIGPSRRRRLPQLHHSSCTRTRPQHPREVHLHLQGINSCPALPAAASAGATDKFANRQHTTHIHVLCK